MKAIILAAGRGKRMENLTEDLPKPLLRVGDKTLLDYIIEALPPDTVEEIIIVVGYLEKKIKEHCQKYYSDRKIIFVEQKELSGTAGAALLARPHIKEGERFAIIYGDEKATKEQMAECLAHEFSWLCREMSDPSQSGVATISADGRIVEVIEKPEKPKSNFVAAGVMVVNTDLFNYPPVRHPNGEYYLTAMMDGFIKSHAVYMVKGTKNVAFSYPEDIYKFNKKSE